MAPLGYDGYLRLGIHRLHRSGDAFGARSHLAAMLDKAKRLTNASRKQEVVDRYDQYAEWFDASGTVVADSKIRIDLFLNAGINIGGEIHRIDVTDTGYRGVLFSLSPSALSTEIRFPLLQLAISRDYGVPLAETAVGVQQLDGSGLVDRVFKRSEVDEAADRFRQAVDQIRSVL